MFRLTQVALPMRDRACVVQAIRGDILSRGELCPGKPFVFCHDLEGHEIKLGHELSTAADPRAPSHGS
jgi:hypothetical protein